MKDESKRARRVADLLNDTDFLMSELISDSKRGPEPINDSGEENEAKGRLAGLRFRPEDSRKLEARADRIWANVSELSFKDKSPRSFGWMGNVVAILLFAFGLAFWFEVSENLGLRKAPEIVEVKAAKGQRVKYVLPDGSRVALYPGSVLRYIKDFKTEGRKVSVKGCTYFDVVHDPEHPFSVEADGLVTEVLGTSFNVISDSLFSSVALVEGKVSVKTENVMDRYTHILVPGQVLEYDKEKGIAQVHKFDRRALTAWKDDILYFKRKPLSEILVDLEQWYGVSFIVAPEVDASRQYSGEFQGESLRNVLVGIGYSNGFSFKFQDRTKVVIF
ncbi:anti-sigma factor [Fulvitalea axinellae]|uniref:Anti-sigma factor n=1 Tax=Fulvitalea axinellae TaxID=1182444 RepID=A0AAU9CN16_9BACT|nr:anti-sigma factor [Fulvitalea axinellae]